MQNQLEDLMQTLQFNDAPAGGSVVVIQQSHIVAEISIGKTFNESNDDWTTDTLSLNYSTGKGMLVTLIHVLVSQKLLAYDDPISQYWQAFGQNGKAKITLREVLIHRSGLFDIQGITTAGEDMYDWALMLSRVEQMSVTTPNNRNAESCYSALVSGWVLGGLIEKVTNQRLNEALNHYLAEPLGLGDQMSFGVDASRAKQVAKPSQHKHGKPKLKIESDSMLNCIATLPSFACWQDIIKASKSREVSETDNTQSELKTADIAGLYLALAQVDINDYRRAMMPTKSPRFDYHATPALTCVMPAVNGIASAKALATMYAMLANKGVWQGKELIRSDVFIEASQVHVQGHDAIMPASTPCNKPSMLWRLGYHKVFSRCHDVTHGFGHMGYDGSMAWCDPSRKLAMAYVHNYPSIMTADIRQFALTEAVLKWANYTTPKK